MVGIDIFSGAGGMSLGAHLAGINVKQALDIDRFALETYASNFPSALIFKHDIRKFESFADISANKDVVLFGGPPCQGFSTSNLRNRSSNNQKNWLFQEFVRVAGTVKPGWFVLENVSGILGTSKGSFVEEIMQSFKRLGYCVEWAVLNARNFGVPQARFRFFVVGNLFGIKNVLPKEKTEDRISVWEAIRDLPDIANGASESKLSYKESATSHYAQYMRRNMGHYVANNLVTRNTGVVIERYNYVPQGGNWQNIPAKLMSNYADRSRCHSGLYRRLDENRPSVVIGNYRKNMLIHPRENRGLSVREAARLQSFPDWFEFKGPLGSQQQQVGNAVPPMLAKSVFSRIIEMS